MFLRLVSPIDRSSLAGDNSPTWPATSSLATARFRLFHQSRLETTRKFGVRGFSG